MSDIQVRDTHVARMTDSTTDEQVISLWIRSKSESTRESYLYDSALFLIFTGKTLQGIRLEDVISFQESLRDAEATNYRRMSVVKSLLTFAHEIGYIPFNVGKVVKLVSPKNTLGERILSHEAMHELIDGADSMRDTLMIRVAYMGALRASEIVGLTWADLSGQVLTIYGKGGITRHIKLPKELIDDLNYYRRDEPDHYAIFHAGDGKAMHRTTAWRIVKRALKNTDIDKPVSTHWARHAHVSHALDNGAPIHLVARDVGHASLQTTSKYAHARPDESSSEYL